ncbi:MAG: SH3 domain-containing protein [Candidatus Hinthialibacter antarcticus]|nr:SH3 domain-containing protein [Candidatus Hinthialibacter antarcticus]
MFSVRVGLCCLITLTFALAAAADTLLLRNGDQVIGTIVGETTEDYVVEVPGELAIQVKIRRSDVIEIIRGGSAEYIAPIPTYATSVVNATQPGMSENPITPPIETIQESGPMPLLPVMVPKGDVYQVSGAGVRFREGPSLSFPGKSLPGRSILLAIEFVDGWLHAKTIEGEDGWIHPNFIAPMNRQVCLVTGDLVNVREAPGDVYRVLGRFRKDDVVVRIEERDAWSRVLSGSGVAGWCSTEYLQPLNDQAAYAPQIAVVENREAGQPVEAQRAFGPSGPKEIQFVVRDERLVRSGMTKLIIFHRDAQKLEQSADQYRGESIYQRDRIDGSVKLLEAGFPEEIGVAFIGVEMLTMLGERVGANWSYKLIAPEDETVRFGFVVQRGPSRGTLVMIDA